MLKKMSSLRLHARLRLHSYSSILDTVFVVYPTNESERNSISDISKGIKGENVNKLHKKTKTKHKS